MLVLLSRAPVLSGGLRRKTQVISCTLYMAASSKTPPHQSKDPQKFKTPLQVQVFPGSSLLFLHINSEKPSDITSFHSVLKKSPGRLHTWKNDLKAGGGAYRHQCSCRFQNQKSVVSRAWKAFQTTGAAIRKVVGGHPRTTAARDDRYIILKPKRGQRKSASVIDQPLSTATGRQVSWFTVTRRHHKGGLFARRPKRCLPLKVDHRLHRLQWCGKHKNWTTDQWSRALFTDESRFSTRSDSHRVLIWREIGTRFYTSTIKERQHYGGPGVLVWGGIMLNV
ncbi:transposable element Tcb2 transposase [Trichonephila clavipes]|nr:transposable element Tcb2 transposase [Trichonephila clavipes]